MNMTLPYAEPLTPREPAERVLPEPPRRGEPGGPPCRICAGKTTTAVWSDENWTLHPPVGGSLPGAPLLQSLPRATLRPAMPAACLFSLGRSELTALDGLAVR